ncbi:DinB family protein [Streptomyces paludis]|uniref:DinB family protein n=1 Tax=Streptomyces paludis TaxID=2282738 RepID=A0A345HPY6_9ACTN|nr:DinB family protein [Streptomyces paludis]AXG78760.1 DinB family protein [Streptomyces paludis]
MVESNPKADLLRYLQDARDSLLWKLEGLSEYDVRRPFTPTGTNLLGLVKHAAGVELGYFGDTFGRPYFDGERRRRPSWWYTESDEHNVDMWASADESREQIVDLYRAAWQHSNDTMAALDLDAPGSVPWWPEAQREVTLHHIVVRVISDTQRHAGHTDIVRELMDGAVGWLPGKDSLPPGDQAWWEEYRGRLERVAREAGG